MTCKKLLLRDNNTRKKRLQLLRPSAKRHVCARLLNSTLARRWLFPRAVVGLISTRSTNSKCRLCQNSSVVNSRINLPKSTSTIATLLLSFIGRSQTAIFQEQSVVKNYQETSAALCDYTRSSSTGAL